MKKYKIVFTTGAVIKINADHLKENNTHYIFCSETGEVISSAWKWNSTISEITNRDKIITIEPLTFVKSNPKSLLTEKEKPKCA